MATTENNTMESIERRRVQLEENIAKLRQSLKHWQEWDLEYGFLKEGIEDAEGPSPDEIIEIGHNLGGSLVNEKEVVELLGKDQPTKRTANQVIDMISRRIDYVQQNITTIQKQIDDAEKKIGGASVLLEPDIENEEGLPYFDIEEELDEDGNVVSSTLSQPGKAAPELVEVLRKTGIKKAELEGMDGKKQTNGDSSTSTTKTAKASKAEAQRVKQTLSTIKPKSAPAKTVSPKKSVTFSEDTKPGPTPKPAAPPRPVYAMPAPDPKPDSTSTTMGTLETVGYNEALADYNFTSGTKVIELNDDEKGVFPSYPIIPQDETPEAAELRRQMLQYGLSEVGAVVAEIDLERPVVEFSDEDEEMYEEYDDDFDHPEDSEAEEDEDQYGRTTRPVLTEEYKKQMMELEKKLNARMMENVGPREDVHPLADHVDDVRTLKILKDDTVDGIMKSSDAEARSKGVRFADNLDASPAPEPAKDTAEAAKSSAVPKSTMSDTIIERSGPAPQPPTSASSKPAKVSRFKAAKDSSSTPPVRMLPPQPIPEPQEFPSGPAGRTLATEVVENPFEPSNSQAPDEFDPAIVNRQIQAEYHKARNTMINRQGGFMPTEDEKEDPLMEERNGKTRKVSRFMAARLRPDEL